MYCNSGCSTYATSDIPNNHFLSPVDQWYNMLNIYSATYMHEQLWWCSCRPYTRLLLFSTPRLASERFLRISLAITVVDSCPLFSEIFRDCLRDWIRMFTCVQLLLQSGTRTLTAVHCWEIVLEHCSLQRTRPKWSSIGHQHQVLHE